MERESYENSSHVEFKMGNDYKKTAIAKQA
jgi:hypothetical protein